MGADVRRALELAEQQLVALELGDVETFLAGVDACEAACLALASLEPGGLPHEEALLLEQLIATNKMVSLELGRAMDDVAGRLASMQQGRQVTGAYLAAGPGRARRSREG